MCRPGGRRCPGVGGYTSRAAARRRANGIYRTAAAKYADSLSPGLGDKIRAATTTDIPAMMEMISDHTKFGGITPSRNGNHAPRQADLDAFAAEVESAKLGDIDTLITRVQDASPEDQPAACERLAELLIQDAATKSGMSPNEALAPLDPDLAAKVSARVAGENTYDPQEWGDPVNLSLALAHPELSQVERELLRVDAENAMGKPDAERTRRERHALEVMESLHNDPDMSQVLSRPLDRWEAHAEDLAAARETQAYADNRAYDELNGKPINHESEYIRLRNTIPNATPLTVDADPGFPDGDTYTEWDRRGFAYRPFEEHMPEEQMQGMLIDQLAYGSSDGNRDMAVRMADADLTNPAHLSPTFNRVARLMDPEVAVAMQETFDAERRANQNMVAAKIAQDAPVSLDADPVDLIAQGTAKAQRLPLTDVEAAAVMHAQYTSGLPVRPEALAYPGWTGDADRIAEGTAPLLEKITADERDRRAQDTSSNVMIEDPKNLAAGVEAIRASKELTGAQAFSRADVATAARVAAQNFDENTAMDTRDALQKLCQTPGVAQDVATEFDAAYEAERIKKLSTEPVSTFLPGFRDITDDAETALAERAAHPLGGRFTDYETHQVAQAHRRLGDYRRAHPEDKDVETEYERLGSILNAMDDRTPVADIHNASNGAAFRDHLAKAGYPDADKKGVIRDPAMRQWADETTSKYRSIRDVAKDAGPWAKVVQSHNGDTAAALMAVTERADALDRIAQSTRGPRAGIRGTEEAQSAARIYKNEPTEANLVRALSHVSPEDAGSLLRSSSEDRMNKLLARSEGKVADISSILPEDDLPSEVIARVSRNSQVGIPLLREDGVRQWYTFLEVSGTTSVRTPQAAATRAAVLQRAQEARDLAYGATSVMERIRGVRELERLTDLVSEAHLMKGEGLPLVPAGTDPSQTLFASAG